MAEGNANTELNHDNWDEMTASPSKFEIQTCLDKKLTNFDEKKCHDVDKYPVNFSGVPHIGEKIFGFLDFKDLNNCHEVCKGWQNFLQEKRRFWIEFLEKEKNKLESFVNCPDRSGDLLFSDLWNIHNDEHDEDYRLSGWSIHSMSEELLELYRKSMTREMENCPECVSEKKDRIKRAKSKSWFGLIEKVKKGPVSDMICLIPKIRYSHHGDLDFCVYLAKAIEAQNVEMDKFLGTEIHRKHEFSANVSLPKSIKEEAENSYNKEILKYLNLLP